VNETLAVNDTTPPVTSAAKLPFTGFICSPAMTTNPSNVLVATPPGEAASTVNDPFIDRSTPRQNRGSLAALVAAIQQVSHHIIHYTLSAHLRLASFSSILPYNQLTAPLHPLSPDHGFAQSHAKRSRGCRASFAHTLTGCATTAASYGLQVENRQPKRDATPRAMHSHHHEPTTRKQHLPDVWQDA
jgi:hypothetical protein